MWRTLLNSLLFEHNYWIIKWQQSHLCVAYTVGLILFRIVHHAVSTSLIVIQLKFPVLDTSKCLTHHAWWSLDLSIVIMLQPAALSRLWNLIIKCDAILVINPSQIRSTSPPLKHHSDGPIMIMRDTWCMRLCRASLRYIWLAYTCMWVLVIHLLRLNHEIGRPWSQRADEHSSNTWWNISHQCTTAERLNQSSETKSKSNAKRKQCSLRTKDSHPKINKIINTIFCLSYGFLSNGDLWFKQHHWIPHLIS